MKRHFLGIGMFAAIASAAQAQDSDYTTFAEQTNIAVPIPPPEHMTAAALLTLQVLGRQQGTCVPTGIRLEAAETAIAEAIITQGVRGGQLKNGWTVYGYPEGCDIGEPTRFMILRMADDSLRAVPVNRGRTLANPSLMYEATVAAAGSAFSHITIADNSCTVDRVSMGPTRIADRGTDLGLNFHGVQYSGSWREVWTFTVCDRTVEVPINFTADGLGGANFNIRSEEVRTVQ